MFRFPFCEVTDITLGDFSNNTPWAAQVYNSCYMRIPNHRQGHHSFWIRTNTSLKEHSRLKDPMNQGRILLLDFTTMTQMKLLTVSSSCAYIIAEALLVVSSKINSSLPSSSFSYYFLICIFDPEQNSPINFTA